jgi:hypothetical protein
MNSNGIVRKIRLGDDISTRCGRCKEEREHQVIALGPGGAPERVNCRTCNSEHRYKGSRQTPSQSASVRRPRSGSRSADNEPAARGIALDYSPKAVYSPGSLISHPKFGTGKVLEARHGKIDVKFGSDLRTLLHGG